MRFEEEVPALNWLSTDKRSLPCGVDSSGIENPSTVTRREERL